MNQREERAHRLKGRDDVLVDGFRFRRPELLRSVRFYVLSHFHSDHYGGLDDSVARHAAGAALVYCSEVTARLVVNVLDVPAERVCPLPFFQRTLLAEEPRLVLTLVPANHCPGAAMLLFEYALAGRRRCVLR